MEKIQLNNLLPDVFVGDKDYQNRHSQVWSADFAFERGKTYCINAGSGTGKTSLCSFIYGVRRDYQGRILFDATDVRRLNVGDWCDVRRRHIAYLPQELDVFGELSALDNVLLKNRLTDFRTEADIRRMFERLEIDDRISAPAARLSVGQRQRVALVRALCQPFDFILLDEPVSHLDEHNNRLCADLVTEAAASLGAGIIFTSVGNPLDITENLISLTL